MATAQRARIAPGGVVGDGNGRYYVTVNGSPTGPAVDVDEAMVVARWLNDGGHAEILLALHPDNAGGAR